MSNADDVECPDCSRHCATCLQPANAGAGFTSRQRGSLGKEQLHGNFSGQGSPPHLASEPAPGNLLAPNNLSVSLFHSQIRATEGHPSRPLPTRGRNYKIAPKNEKLSFRRFKKRINSPNFFHFFHFFSRIVRVFHATQPLFPNPKQPPKKVGQKLEWGQNREQMQEEREREAKSRESRSQHVLRTGIPKPPLALPRF